MNPKFREKLEKEVAEAYAETVDIITASHELPARERALVADMNRRRKAAAGRLAVAKHLQNAEEIIEAQQDFDDWEAAIEHEVGKHEHFLLSQKREKLITVSKIVGKTCIDVSVLLVKTFLATI